MGKAFYDNAEHLLNYVLKTRGKFHSYIQSDHLSMDIDKKGQLLNIEVGLDKVSWVVRDDLTVPTEVPLRKLRFPDYRLDIECEEYFTNDSKDMLYIRFAEDKHVKTYEIAENLFADVNLVSELAGFWLLGVDEDYGFKKEMAFRRGSKAKG